MNMTKRDVADIVLVWLGISFLVSLVRGIIGLWAFFLTSFQYDSYMDRASAGFLQLLQVGFLLGMIYMLLFKRHKVLALLFRGEPDKTVDLPPGLAYLATYAFWIRIFGLYICLSSAVTFLSHLASGISLREGIINHGFTSGNSGSSLFAAILGAVVIWQADWIAQKVEELKAR